MIMGWYAYNIMVILLIVIEYIVYFYVLGGQRFRIRCDKLRGALFVAGTVLCALTVIWDSQLIINLMAAVYAFILAVILYGMSFKSALNIMIVASPVLEMFEGIVRLVIKYKVMPDERILVAMGIAATILIMLIYYFLLGRRLRKDAFLLPMRISVMVSAAVFAVMMMTTFFDSFIGLEESPKVVTAGFVVTTVGSIVIFIIIFGMIYYFNVKTEYQIENEGLERYNEQQREYFENLLERENATRQFRHDIISELTEIRGFCSRGEYDALDKYVSEMMHDISDISKRSYDVGNEVVNTMLNYYLYPVRKSCDIRVTGYVADKLAIGDRDLCILVSNLLKNAVEAVDRQKEEDKSIVFDIHQGKMNTYISVCNSLGDDKLSLSDGRLETTKDDKHNHGYGIKNIENIVNHYDGDIRYKIESNKFVVDIMIKK